MSKMIKAQTLDELKRETQECYWFDRTALQEQLKLYWPQGRIDNFVSSIERFQRVVARQQFIEMIEAGNLFAILAAAAGEAPKL